MTNQVIATIHGVSSESDGLADLGEFCRRTIPGLTHEVVYWGKWPPWLLKNRNRRETIYRTVYYSLFYLAKTQQGKDITVVCHSFGTMAFAEALGRMVPDLRVKNVVLLGSIVRRDFYWGGYKSVGMVSQVFNFVRPFDWVVNKSHLIGGGFSGTRGFISDANNVFKRGGHSSYNRHDFADIIRIIQTGSLSSGARTFHEWYSQLSLPRRLAYQTLKFCKVLR